MCGHVWPGSALGRWSAKFSFSLQTGVGQRILLECRFLRRREHSVELGLLGLDSFWHGNQDVMAPLICATPWLVGDDIVFDEYHSCTICEQFVLILALRLVTIILHLNLC